MGAESTANPPRHLWLAGRQGPVPASLTQASCLLTSQAATYGDHIKKTLLSRVDPYTIFTAPDYGPGDRECDSVTSARDSSPARSRSTPRATTTTKCTSSSHSFFPAHVTCNRMADGGREADARTATTRDAESPQAHSFGIIIPLSSCFSLVFRSLSHHRHRHRHRRGPGSC